VRSRERKSAKAIASGAAALAAQQGAVVQAEERRRVAEARAAVSEARLASMVRELHACDAEQAALRAQVSVFFFLSLLRVHV
jgi:hypothetical protein